MPLTPTRARELLSTHTAILQGRLSRYSYAAHDVDADELSPLCFSSFTPLVNGTRMRLACDLMATVSACAGFAPSENPSFWRGVLLELLPPGHPGPRNTSPSAEHELPPVDEAVCCFGATGLWHLQQPDASAFWRDFLTDGALSLDPTAIETQRDREALERELGPFVVRPIKPLTLDLRCGFAPKAPDRARQHTFALDMIVGCVRDLRAQRDALVARGIRLDEVALSPLRDVRVVLTLTARFGESCPSQAATDTLASVIRTFAEGSPATRVGAIQFFGTTCSPSPGSSRAARLARVRVACTLLRSAPQLTSIMSCRSAESFDIHGAILSAVPHSSASLSYDIGTDTTRLLRLAWLAYAVFHPGRRRARLRRSLAITSMYPSSLSDCEIQYIDTIVRTGFPLGDVVTAVLHNRYGIRSRTMDVALHSFGVSGIVARGTVLFSEPGRTAAQYIVITASYDEEVDVVAHLAAEAFVGIVYPGAGLVWVPEATLTWIPSRSAWNVDATKPVGTLLRTKNLQLELLKASQPRQFAHTPPRSPLPLFLGPQLRSFALNKYSPLEADDLELILAWCPHLQHLEIRQCVIQSLWPLVDAFTTEEQPCRVSSLRLASTGSMFYDAMVETRSVESRSQRSASIIQTTPTNVFGPLVDALCDASHALTQRLRVLHADLRGTAQEDQTVEQIARALRTNTTRLEVLSVKTQATSAGHLPRAFGSHRDRVVVDARRTRLALLSVLRARGWWTATRSTVSPNAQEPPSVRLCEESLRSVFAFAGGSVMRHVNWLFRPLQPMGGRYQEAM